MTDYSLWEVILNGDSPAPTRVVEGVLQSVAPTTAEQRLARKNELKACAIEKRFGGNTATKKVQKTLLKQQYENFSGSSTESLDQIHDRLQKLISQLEILRRNKTNLEDNSLKINEAEVKSSSSASTSTQNIAFVSSFNTDSTNEPVSAAPSVSAVCAKMSVSSFPNVNSLSYVMIYLFFASQSSSPQLDNDDLKQIDADDLEEMDLKWHMTMTVPVETSTSNALVSQCDDVGSYDWSFQAEEDPTNYALMAFSSSSSSSDNEKCLNSVNHDVCLNNCVNGKKSRGSDESLPPSPIYDRYQSGNGYHAVPPPYTGTFMPPKPDLVFNNVPNVVETDHPAFNVKLSLTEPDQDLSHTIRPSTPIIEDWVSDSEDESETKTPQNVPSFIQSTKQVKYPRPSVQHVETSILAVTPKPARYAGKMGMETKMPNSRPCFSQHKCINDPKKGNPQHALQDKGVIDSGCLRHMTGNMSYLSNFEELNGGYVAFGGNPKGDKIFGKDSLDKFDEKADEGFLVGYSVSSKAFRVFNSRTRIVQETLHAINLTLVQVSKNNLMPKKQGRKLNNNVCFFLWSSGSTNPQSTDGDAAFDEKEHELDEKKPEFKVNVSPSNSAQSKKHDDKTKKKAKGKIPVESLTGYINLSAEFKDFSNDSINEVNAAGTLVPAVGQLSPNSTNTFSAAGLSNAATSPTQGKSLCIDTSQLSDDPDMLELEDITYSDDKDDVGAEADFNNLETSITEEGIDYEEVFAPIARIVDIRLFLAYAFFMGFMVYQMDVKSAFLYGTIEEEFHVYQPLGFEDLDYPDKVYKVVKALYGLHQAPRAWHMVPAVVLTQSKPVHITTGRPVSTVVLKIKVTRPRQPKPIVTKPKSSTRRHIKCSPSPKASNSPPRVTVVQAPIVNAAQGMQGKWEWKPKCPILDHVSRNTSASMTLKRFDYNDALGRSKSDKGVIDSGCLRYMTGNMSYLSDFEELNGGYVAFGGNPKGDKIFRKGKIRTGKLDFDDVYFVKELTFKLFSVLQMCDKKNSVLFTDTKCLVLPPEFKLPDENHVLLRVPRENNMYNADLKNIVPFVDLTWEEIEQQCVLFSVWSSGSTNPQSTNGDAAFDEKEHELDEKKPEFKVNVSPSNSAQSKKHDDKTKKEAKGKIPVESLTGYINLSAEFEDFSDDSINKVNAAGTLVPAVGQLSPNSTNTFSAAGPSNAAASPTHGKSLCIDTSQLSDDPDMLELEDITYSDDKDDVGAEADFNNLETSITVSPIPITRVHKDHPVT
nr:putative ribonuclease H-like domain-containing protein [Tanacetum cinerariifolium]